MLVDIHTHSASNKNIEIVNSFAGEDYITKAKYLSLGYHPWYLKQSDIFRINKRTIKKSPGIIALGETGLDKVCKTDFELQKDFFIKHCQLAEELNMPVIIHNVRYTNEIISIQKKFANTKFIFHGFMGNKDEAKQIIKNNNYISLGNKSLDSKKTIAAVTELPFEKLFLETDNSNKNIDYIYLKFSNIFAVNFNELKIKLFNNFKNLFKGNEYN